MEDRRNSNSSPHDSSPLKITRNIINRRLLDGQNWETRNDGVLYSSAGASNHSKNSQMRNDVSSSVTNPDAMDIVAGNITEYVKCILHPILSKFAPSMQNPQASATDEQNELFNCVCKCHQQIFSKGSSASSEKDGQNTSLYFDASHFQQVLRNCLHDVIPESGPTNYATPNFTQALVPQIQCPISTGFQTPRGAGQRVSEDCSHLQQAIQNRSAEKNTSKVVVNNTESSTPTAENITGVHQLQIYNRSAGKNTSDVVADNPESSNPSSGNISGVLTTLPGTSEQMNVQGYVQLTCSSCRKNYHDVTSQGSCLMFAKCGHIFCRPCTKKLLRKREPCPRCNTLLNHRGVHKILL